MLLLVTNGELALRLLVLVRESGKSLNSLALQYRQAELGVGLGVFVTGLDSVCQSFIPSPNIPSLNQRSGLTKTRVSSGKEASVSFRALCISAPFPSKKRPQPGKSLCQFDASHGKTPTPNPKVTHTSMEKRITSKHDLVVPILHEPAYAILRMAGRMQSLDGDAADVETFAVGRGLVHLVAVLAADDFEVGEAEGGALLMCE